MQIGLALAAAAAIAAASPSATGGDWAAYGRDEGGGRYSPLTGITPANVAGLKVAWTYHMRPPGSTGAARAFSTTTPLKIGDRLFLGTPFGRVVALDPATGRELWAYGLPKGDQPAFRGLGYWPGDEAHAPRLIFGTLRGSIIALDATTGAPIADFGSAGIIDTRTPDVMNDAPAALYGYSAPPTIYRDIAIFGSRVQENGNSGPAGDVRAWNVVTGKPVWTFRAIPRPGERFHETWQGDDWQRRSGVNMWNMASVDQERGIAYLTFSAPTFDRWGGDRKGANLFANSIVAVNAATGRYLWHFQTVHHDIWDYDLHTTPVLLTIRRGGRVIPAVAAMNKTAFLFLLDRRTGRPIHGVKERHVPASSVAGEAAWPTQPFPVRPGILTRMSFGLDEIATVTPAHEAACRALVAEKGLVGSGMFEPLRTDATAVRFPGAAGGPEWGGGTFDPRLGLYVFPVNALGWAERLVRKPNGEYGVTNSTFVDPATGSPCQQPPWGELVAVNVNSGRVAWRTHLGVTDAFPEAVRDTGRPSNGGPITTASGLTFIGGTDDSRFRAFDTRTGRELWTYRLEHSAHATPITYLDRAGRQYVAVVATGGSYLGSPGGGDSLVAFGLEK